MDLSIRPGGVPPKKEHVGVDVFIDQRDGDPEEIAARAKRITIDGVKLVVIANRGSKVWPDGNPDTFLSDQWSLRFEGKPFNGKRVAEIIAAMHDAGFDVIKTEGLFTFDGERGYSLAQGQ